MNLSCLPLRRFAPALVWSVGVVLLLVLAALELRVGSRLVGWRDVFLFPTGPETIAQAILETTRAPRLVAAISTGAALALAGSVLQTVLRNPLAAPDILSVTSGAQLFLVVSTLLLPLSLPPIVVTSAGGLAGAAACLALAGGFQAPPGRLALSGVAVSLCFSAVSSAIVLIADERASGLLLWSSGILDQTGWSRTATATPLVLLSFVALIVMARALDLLGTGRQGFGKSGGNTGRHAFRSAHRRSSMRLRRNPCRAHRLRRPCSPERIARIGYKPASPPPAAFSGLGSKQPPPCRCRHAISGAQWHDHTYRRCDCLPRCTGHAIPAAQGKDRGERRIGLPIGIAPPPFLLAVGALVALGLLTMAASLATGDGISLTLAEVTGNLDLRAPRLLVALGCGALLAAAGTVLQAVTRNPLCGPETLGLTQGAALFSLVALLLGLSPATPTFQVVALLGAITVLLLLRLLAPKNSPEKLVLAGVAIAASLGAAATIIVLEARLQTAQALSWLVGSTHARGYADAFMLMPWVFALSAIGLLFSRHLDAFLLGDEKARSLGLATGTASKYAMVYAASAVAIAVSSIGAVSFVALLAPHAARLLTGARHAKNLPIAMILGAVMLAFADTVGRSIIAPLELPAGIITAIIGAPAFMILLRSGLRSRLS